MVLTTTQTQSMSIPQRITAVTLGAREMSSLRAFYRALGWHENDGSDDEFTAFTAGGVRLALYPMGLLGAEAAPGEVTTATDWNGVTFTVNVAGRSDVDRALYEAVEAGGRLVTPPTDRDWGGYTGYIADPEGNRWEIAWAPGFLESE